MELKLIQVIYGILFLIYLNFFIIFFDFLKLYNFDCFCFELFIRKLGYIYIVYECEIILLIYIVDNIILIEVKKGCIYIVSKVIDKYGGNNLM